MAESRVISDLITGECGETSAPVRFLYDPADPYAVVMDLTALASAAADGCTCSRCDDTSPVLWTFARSLLVRALVGGHAGPGDVVIERAGVYLDVTLTSPEGTGTFRFPAQALHRFVLRTEALVLVGDESRHLDVDAAITELLRGVR